MFLDRLIRILLFFRIDFILNKVKFICFRLKVERLSMESESKINVIPQGGYDFDILGPVKNFHIDPTSHIKTGSYIDCSGGVTIGQYFHCGRGLTIFSSEHLYKDAQKIPYDKLILNRKVTIGDFVWIGANVTILPGVTIGEGSIIGAGSIVTKDVDKLSIVVGNPAREISSRNAEHFYKLKTNKEYF